MWLTYVCIINRGKEKARYWLCNFSIIQKEGCFAKIKMTIRKMLMITLYAEQKKKKKTQIYRTVF